MLQRIFLASLVLVSAAANAELVRGNTANGCSYQVINGEYRYNCDAKAPQGLAPAGQVVADQTTSVAAANTAVPEVTPPQPQVMPVTIVPVQNQNERVLGEGRARPVHSRNSYSSIEAEAPEAASPADKVYVGAQLGNTTVTKAQNGSTGISLNLGTDIDDFWGIEIDYSYAKQDMLMGLANRQGAGTISTTSKAKNDSTLSTHLISAEAQWHLTESGRRLRPFAGGGLGFRFAKLAEDLPYSYTGYQSSPYTVSRDAELKQTSFGAVTSAGVKFQVSDSVQLAGIFRYFLPLSRQDAVVSSESSRLNQGDSDFTGSSQYQLSAGLLVFF